MLADQPRIAPWCSIGSSTCCTIFPLGTFDVVFCRNVLIYFDQDTKINIFNRLRRTMESDSFLVLGAAETVVGLTETFKPYPDRRGLYRPNDPRAAKAPAIAASPRLAAMARL